MKEHVVRVANDLFETEARTVSGWPAVRIRSRTTIDSEKKKNLRPEDHTRYQVG